MQAKLKDFKYTGKKPCYRITRYMNEDENIKSISLPKGVGIIRKNAFIWSKLEEIILPAGLQCIEEDAFLNCRKLKRIWIPNSVVEIGKNAFKGCYDLKIYLEGEETEGFTVKEEYQWVEEYADTYVFDFHRGGTSDGGYISVYKKALSSWNPEKSEIFRNVKLEDFLLNK